jgi:hypothetical protein
MAFYHGFRIGTLFPSGDPAIDDKVSERAASSTPFFRRTVAMSEDGQIRYHYNGS